MAKWILIEYNEAWIMGGCTMLNNTLLSLLETSPCSFDPRLIVLEWNEASSNKIIRSVSALLEKYSEGMIKHTNYVLYDREIALARTYTVFKMTEIIDQLISVVTIKNESQSSSINQTRWTVKLNCDKTKKISLTLCK